MRSCFSLWFERFEIYRHIHIFLYHGWCFLVAALVGWREKIYLLNFFLVQMVLAGWRGVAAIALLGLGI